MVASDILITLGSAYERLEIPFHSLLQYSDMLLHFTHLTSSNHNIESQYAGPNDESLNVPALPTLTFDIFSQNPKTITEQHYRRRPLGS